MEEKKIFIDTKGKRWKYVKPKSGGARLGAEYTGTYQQIDDRGQPLDNNGQPLIDGNGQQPKLALIKSDLIKSNNIAEYLAGVVYGILIPNNSPPGINLARPEDEIDPPYTTYIVSEFINDATTLVESIGGKDSVTAVNLYGPLGIIGKELAAKCYEGLSDIIIPALLVGDTDRHAGNLMVVALHNGLPVKKDKKGKWIKSDGNEIELNEKDLTYKIYTIDFGSAYESHTIYNNKIRLNYGLKNFLMQRLKGVKINNQNHIRYFPIGAKFSLETVHAIENAIVKKKEIKAGYDKAVKNIKKYFSVEEIRSFFINKLDVTPDNNLSVEELGNILNENLKLSLKMGINALKDLAAQIEVGLCIGPENRVLDWKHTEHAENMNIQDIVCKYLDFFVKLLSDDKEVKLLRFPTHKRTSKPLKEATKLYAAAVFSNVLVARKEFASIDEAYAFLIDPENKEQIKTKLKDINTIDPNTLWTTPSLLGLALNGQLDQDHSMEIRALIQAGSDFDMKLPNGKYLIDYAKDFETKLLLVQNGAKLTKGAMEGLSPTEQQDLAILNILNSKVSDINDRMFAGVGIEKVKAKYRAKLEESKPPIPYNINKGLLALFNLSPILLGTGLIAGHMLVLDSPLKSIYTEAMLASFNKFVLQSAEKILADKHFEPLLNAIKDIVENNNALPVLIAIISVLGLTATLITSKVVIDNDPYKKLEAMVEEGIRIADKDVKMGLLF